MEQRARGALGLWLWSVHVIGISAAAGVGVGIGIIAAVRPICNVIERRSSPVAALIGDILGFVWLCMVVAVATIYITFIVAKATGGAGKSAILTTLAALAVPIAVSNTM